MWFHRSLNGIWIYAILCPPCPAIYSSIFCISFFSYLFTGHSFSTIGVTANRSGLVCNEHGKHFYTLSLLWNAHICSGFISLSYYGWQHSHLTCNYIVVQTIFDATGINLRTNFYIVALGMGAAIEDNKNSWCKFPCTTFNIIWSKSVSFSTKYNSLARFFFYDLTIPYPIAIRVW